MANFNLYEYKTGKRVLWALFIALVIIYSVHPIMMTGFSRLWMLTRWHPFIYLILNFIVISILIFSSSFTRKLNTTNLILKLHKMSSQNMSSLISQTSHKFSDDDTWWSRIVNSEETTVHDFTSLDGGTTKLEDFTVKEANKYEDEYGPVVASGVGEEELEEEVDTLDATWKAIMEAKSKGIGAQLKKSGTWTAGDEDAKAGKYGRLAKYKVGLKNWSTLGRKLEASGGGAGGGGFRRKDVGLTYHDEFKNRADAFIARVTNDMRLQRLDSEQLTFLTNNNN